LALQVMIDLFWHNGDYAKKETLVKRPFDEPASPGAVSTRQQ
jgi:hypothetical protein